MTTPKYKKLLDVVSSDTVVDEKIFLLVMDYNGLYHRTMHHCVA